MRDTVHLHTLGGRPRVFKPEETLFRFPDQRAPQGQPQGACAGRDVCQTTMEVLVSHMGNTLRLPAVLDTPTRTQVP